MKVEGEWLRLATGDRCGRRAPIGELQLVDTVTADAAPGLHPVPGNRLGLRSVEIDGDRLHQVSGGVEHLDLRATGLVRGDLQRRADISLDEVAPAHAALGEQLLDVPGVLL